MGPELQIRPHRKALGISPRSEGGERRGAWTDQQYQKMGWMESTSFGPNKGMVPTNFTNPQSSRPSSPWRSTPGSGRSQQGSFEGRTPYTVPTQSGTSKGDPHPQEQRPWWSDDNWSEPPTPRPESQRINQGAGFQDQGEKPKEKQTGSMNPRVTRRGEDQGGMKQEREVTSTTKKNQECLITMRRNNQREIVETAFLMR